MQHLFYYVINSNFFKKMIKNPLFVWIVQPLAIWFFFILTLYLLFIIFITPDPYLVFLKNLDSNFDAAISRPTNALLIHVKDYAYSSDFPNQETWDSFKEKNKDRNVTVTLSLIRPLDDSANSPEDLETKAIIEQAQPFYRFNPYAVLIFKSEHISTISISDDDIKRNLAALKTPPHCGLPNVEAVFILLTDTFLGYGPRPAEFSSGLELACSRANTLHGSTAEVPLADPLLRVVFYPDKDSFEKYLNFVA